MVNVSGLQRRSTYEEVAKAAELDEFRDLIKTPDRLPKTIIDSPSMTALEGGGGTRGGPNSVRKKQESRDGPESSSRGDSI